MIKHHHKGAPHKEKTDQINNAKKNLATLFFRTIAATSRSSGTVTSVTSNSATRSTAAANTSSVKEASRLHLISFWLSKLRQPGLK